MTKLVQALQRPASGVSHGAWRLAAIVVVGTLFAAGVVVPAQAATDMQIAFTRIGIYPRAEPSMQSAKVGNALPDETVVSVDCEAEGVPTSNASETSAVWERLADGTWIPNVFVRTGYLGWTPGVPRCDEVVTAEPPVQEHTQYGLYDRSAAAAWAYNHALDDPVMDEDCTWFVTQALWAGGFNDAGELTSYTADGVFGNDLKAIAAAAVRAGIPPWQPFNPSRTTTMANKLPGYLESEGWATITKITWSDNTAQGAQLGDIIAYDWDAGTLEFQHLAMVTSLNDKGYPSVSQHSEGRQNRYWSYLPPSNESSGGWIEEVTQGKAVAYLIHIIF